jgi:hypothetical protein
MAEQQLDRAQIGAGFQQMNCEGMAQGMRGDPLRNPGTMACRQASLRDGARADRRPGRSPGKSHTFGRSAFQ